MMQVKDLHLCDYAFLAEGGKLSLIGIFGNVLVRAVPTVINPFHIVAVLRSEATTKTELEVTILDPEDKVVFKGSGPVTVETGKNFNFLLGIAGFKVERPGTYIIRFVEKGNELIRVDLPILMQVGGQPASKPQKV